MNSSTQAVEAQPVFDPEDVGASLSELNAQIPIRVAQLAGRVLGEYISLRKGDGSDKDGTREFQPGDRAKDIDWRAMARQSEEDGPVLVRERFRDVTPDLYVVTDLTQRRFAADTRSYYQKQRLGLSVVTAFMRTADVMGMPSSVLAFGDHDVIAQRPEPQRGRNQQHRTAQQLADMVLGPTKQTTPRDIRLVDALEGAAKKVTDSAVVLVSDWRDEVYTGEPFEWEYPLERLKKQDNSVIVVEITDPRDFNHPATVTRSRNLDTNAVNYVGFDKRGQAIRATFAEDAAAQQTAIDDVMAQLEIPHLKLSTSDPLWRDTLVDDIRSLPVRP